MNLVLSPSWIAIITIAANAILYKLLNRRTPKRYLTHHWDAKIPLLPVWVYPYVSYYFFVGYTFILFVRDIIGVQFLISYTLGTLFAALIWFLFPTGVKRPKTNNWLLTHLYTHDGDANAIPSGHVLHTFICAYYLYISLPTHIPTVLICAGLIIISTVMVKQHYLADVGSGLIVGILSVLLGSRIA